MVDEIKQTEASQVCLGLLYSRGYGGSCQPQSAVLASPIKRRAFRDK